MTSDEHWFESAVPAQQSLAMAVNAFASVPAGWKGLWRATLRRLVAVRTPEREFALNYLSVESDDHLLEPDMPFMDDVLTGIVRRCSARSRFICRLCGRRGILRQFGMSDAAVLCPRCAAPELLHRAIDEAVAYPGLIAIGGRVDGLKLVPEVLRRAFTSAAIYCAGAGTSSEPGMSRLQFDRWVEDLKPIKRALPPRVAVGE